MFFGNLLFVLSFPFAVGQIFRALLGGLTFSSTFSGLDEANAAALLAGNLSGPDNTCPPEGV